GNASGVYLNGTNTLNATKGNITINGSTEGFSIWNYGVAGITMLGNATMTAANISINGSGLNERVARLPDTKGISFEGGNFTFTGNTTITGTAIAGPGVGFANTNNITFNNGTAVINASNTGNRTQDNGYGAAFGTTSATEDKKTIINITLNNTNLSINASSINGAGIGGLPDLDSNITISGTGNAAINGTSREYYGILFMNVSGSGLNGTVTLTGTSTNNTGVALGNNHLDNVAITGNSSGNGKGVHISGNSSLTNTTINGSSVNNTGVYIRGNLTNTTVSGSGVSGVDISAN
ncbi:hypothetical protein PN744_004877, partial [Escherichia coli]|nr:hypothetical protein [Escherichia coli]